MLFLFFSGLCTLPLVLSQTSTEPAVLTTTATTCVPGLPGCQKWTQFGSRYFIVNSNLLNWNQAEQICVNMGGHLASVHRSSQYTFIKDLVFNATGSNKETWIGGSDTAQPGKWVWSDGSAFDYSIWTPGQPDNLGIESCIHINAPVNWNNRDCNTYLPSVCAKCQDGWSQFGFRCFVVNTNVATWSKAEQNCVNLGGHLASVHSHSEYSFIQALVLQATGSSPVVWIGATDSAQPGVWVWSDGSAFDYSNWTSGQPDNLGIEDCIHINAPVNWNNSVCNTNFSSVCAKISIEPACAPGLPGCQNWTQFGSRYFIVNTNLLNWNQAEQNCVNWGGHLASVHRSSQYTFIQDLVFNATGSNKETWIGGSDTAQPGKWVWSDGSAFDYSIWTPGQPDNLGIESCIHINAPVNWNNRDCNTYFPSVCAKCQDGWSQFGSRCFVVNTNVATWSEAEQNCVNLGGHLTSVHSDSEYSFIQALVLQATGSSPEVWIGATDSAQEGVWVWSDGSEFNYTVWSHAQPDGLGVENCIIMNYNVRWNDAVCNIQRQSVCAITFNTTTVKPTTGPPTTVQPTTTPATSPNVMIARLRIISNQDLKVSNNSQVLLQKIKTELIKNGLPDNFTLELKSITKKSP